LRRQRGAVGKDKMVMSYFKEKNHVKLKGAAYRKFAEKVMDRDNWRCVHCGTTQNLTVMHLIHRGAGGGNGPGDVISNVVTGCMACHDKEDRHIGGRIKK
jgi:5-methylcytosine-specific restriction endonuclease McrA